jgi:hypothetical protein
MWVLYIAEEGDKKPFDKCIIYQERDERDLQDAQAEIAERMPELFYALTEGEEDED